MATKMATRLVLPKRVAILVTRFAKMATVLPRE